MRGKEVKMTNPIYLIRRLIYNYSYQLMSTSPTTTPDTLVQVKRTFSLSKNETTLFEIFKQACHSSSELGRPVVCRVAGGWVRDKLISGTSSNDLDIVLDTMMGYDFAELVMAYIHKNKHLYTNVHLNKISKINANPEKSKHLETATCKLLDMDLDFVNLRSETYVAHTRIPDSVTFGTPVQDSLRRDCTINALFYNIHTDQVEDHCMSGINDLKLKIINTPQQPLVTFTDDPLRMLRLVRFASRFKFGLSPLIYSTIAMHQHDLQASLVHKVSKERVGVEMCKILDKPNPSVGLAILQQLDLFTSITFPPPPMGVDGELLVLYEPAISSEVLTLLPFPVEYSSYLNMKLPHTDMSRTYKLSYTQLIQQVQASDAHKLISARLAILEWMGLVRNSITHPMPKLNQMPNWSKYFNHELDTSYMIPASFVLMLHSFSKYWWCPATSTNKSTINRPVSVIPLVTYIIQTNYKLPNREAEWVAHVHYLLPSIQNLVLHIGGLDDAKVDTVHHEFRYDWTVNERIRIILGRFVRLLGTKFIHEHWPIAFALSLTIQLSEFIHVDFEPRCLLPSVTGLNESNVDMARVEELVLKYTNLLDRIYDLDLDTAWESKPILDGNEVACLLSIPKGPQIKDALDWVMEFQLARPDATNSECKIWLKQNFYPNPVKRKP